MVAISNKEVNHETKQVFVYNGSITYEEKRNRYQVCYQENNQTIRKIFQRKESLSEAVAYRNKKSNERGKTVIKPANYVDLEEKIPNDIQQYIAGFFDGDGSIYITSETKLTVAISQSCDSQIPEVFTIIQQYYGGSVTSRKRESDRFYRKEHTLSFYHEYAQALLESLTKNAIIKREQAELGLEYTTMRRKMNKEITKRREEIKNKLFALKDDYANSTILPDRITSSYVAGIFDAEGCVYVCDSKDSVICQLKQMGCKNILNNIFQFLKLNGCVSGGQLTYQGKAAKSFLDLFTKNLIVKKEQAILALDYFKTKIERKEWVASGKRKRENVDEISFDEKLDNISQKIKQLKRE